MLYISFVKNEIYQIGQCNCFNSLSDEHLLISYIIYFLNPPYIFFGLWTNFADTYLILHHAVIDTARVHYIYDLFILKFIEIVVYMYRQLLLETGMKFYSKNIFQTYNYWHIKKIFNTSLIFEKNSLHVYFFTDGSTYGIS